MKKLLLLIFLFTSIISFGQATRKDLGIDSASGNVKLYSDTIVVAPYIANYFLNGFARYQKFDSTARLALSMDTTASAYSYDNTTGIIHIHPGSGGGGSSSTVQQDSAFLIATYHMSRLGTPEPNKGLLVRDTNAILGTGNLHYTPAIMLQLKNGATQRWFRIYGTDGGTDGSFKIQTSSDSITWSGGISIAGGGITTTSAAGGNALSFANAILSGTKFNIDGRGFGAIGATSATAPNIFQITPSYSPTNIYGLGLPQMSVVNRANYPTAISTGAIGSGGSGYVTATYNNKTLTNISGNGSGAAGNFTVSGGIVTAFTKTVNGSGYKAGDTLTTANSNLGGSGSGFTYIVGTTQGDTYNGTLYYDSSLDKVVYWKGHSHVNAPLVDSITVSGNLTVSSASTLTLVAGQDYSFTGTTATYTLPAISTTAIGRQNRIYIKNRGSGTITLNAASGSTIYTTSAVSTINIIAGAACELLPDGTYYNVMYNN